MKNIFAFLFLLFPTLAWAQCGSSQWPANTTCGTVAGGLLSGVPSTSLPAGTITIGSTPIGGGTPNGLLYDAAGFVGNLATANNALLVTNGSGVPSISQTLNGTTFNTDGGIVLGAPTGGDKGASTINAAGGIFVNNVSTSGTTNLGTAGQLAYYPATAAAVSGNSNATMSNGGLTLGTAGTTIGTLTLSGNTSGTAVITPQAAAGTPTLTLGTSSGTPMVTVSAPLALSAATGNGSITGAAGQILAGATPAFTATPTLGASGTLGSLTFGNATSGLLTLQTVTGALGTVTLSLPAATDQLIARATTDTLTNKTYDTAGTGNSFLINGLAATANTGTGAVVRATSPALVTPALGAATATSINGLAITSSTGTLTIANGKTLTANNSLTLAGTDATTLTFQGTDTYVGRATTDTLTNKTFDTAGAGNVLKINGTQVSAVTGTGSVVLATTPTFVTNITDPLVIGGTGAGSSLTLESTSGAGTTDSIVFQTGSQVTRETITSGGSFGFGTETNPQSTWVLSKNTTTGISPTVGGGFLQMIQANGSNLNMEYEAFGTAIRTAFVGRTANGTAASPTASQANDIFVLLGGNGRGATAFGTSGFQGAVNIIASQTWTDANQGTAVTVQTTPNNSTAIAEAARFQASGGFSIGTTTDPGIGSLQINAQMFIPNITTSSAAQTGTVCWTTGTGKFTADTTVGCLTSSARFKHDIAPLDNGLATIMALKPVTYAWNDPVMGAGEQVGLIAEDVYAADARLGGLGEDGQPRGWKQPAIIAELVRAVQELKADNDNLRALIYSRAP